MSWAPCSGLARKPFEGTTLTVLTLDSGPRGGISGPIFSFRPIWEELSGGTLEIALTPVTEPLRQDDAGSASGHRPL